LIAATTRFHLFILPEGRKKPMLRLQLLPLLLPLLLLAALPWTPWAAAGSNQTEYPSQHSPYYDHGGMTSRPPRHRRGLLQQDSSTQGVAATRISSFKVYGERNCGTRYLAHVLGLNFVHVTHLSLPGKLQGARAWATTAAQAS
jgi:hypothetical protein